jgi:hypothetical protein
MTAYTDFHYSPTGSGVISGAQVLEQTEQGINGLGHYVQDNVSGAIDVANQALTTAQSADSNATAAINLANSFNAQIITANQNASNALTTAQSAQNTANSASSLATAANNNATTALNAANSASAGVTTLTGTVNSLGNRMTAAENAISANAGNITTLQNNLATTNANVTAAANAASSAQATATSAQSTATLARNQAYVLRYTGTTITGGGTIAYADIDNTDNIKAGDKIIDATGAVYAIASVDIANETVTVSASEIINLAVLPDLFNSANTWSEANTYAKTITVEKYTNAGNFIVCKNSKAELGSLPSGADATTLSFQDKNGDNLGYLGILCDTDGTNLFRLFVRNKFASGSPSTSGNPDYVTFQLLLHPDQSKECVINALLRPRNNNTYDLGSSSYQWNNVYSKRVNTQTLNGINPGALSLPKIVAKTSADISSAIVGADGETQYLDGTDNNYTAALDGWISMSISGFTQSNELWITVYDQKNETWGTSAESSTSARNTLFIIFPIRANQKMRIRMKCTTVTYARFYPCEGNV